MQKILTIVETKLHIGSFIERFENAENFSVESIFMFYQSKDQLVRKSTVNWRIHKLVDKGLIQRIGRGKYKLGKQKLFNPLVSKRIQSLFHALKYEYPYLGISIWTTEWISQWMLHVPENYETIIEVEKGAEESVFFFISDTNENVFLNPSRDILDKYAKENKSKIIVKNLITDAPLQRIIDVQIPTIEKILVDLILDKELYSNYQGRDLESIIENAYEFNSIQEDKMLRYATRRRKRTFVKQFIKTVI